MTTTRPLFPPAPLLRSPSALRRAAHLLLLSAAGCAGGAAPGSMAPAAQDFARLADSILVTPPLERGRIGIEVYDPVARRVLYARDSERRFVPASNQKLWPTATALELLGPGFRYRTPVLAVGFEPSQGTARGLVVVGRGDPTLSARFLPEETQAAEGGADTPQAPPDPVADYRRELSALGALADSVVAAGVRTVDGDLVVDASYFADEIIPGTWTFGNLNGTSAPPTGAFVVAEGVFRVVVAPGAASGSPAEVAVLAPAGVVPLVSTVVTAEEAPRRGISERRGPWSDTLRLSGTVGVGTEPQTLRFPMTDPVRFAAEVFAEALRARGVTLGGSVRIVHDSIEAASIREGRLDGDSGLPVREVAAWTSPPLGEIVHGILAPSQNWIAEQLLRTLGAERGEGGGWEEGIDVETDFLFNTVGIDSAALRLTDGSGMAHQNMVTPHAVVQLLDHARTAPWGETFRAALATPGQPGTLSNRLTHLEGRMSGKTGTLNSVNALSGYVRRSDGRELIFSIMSNASGLPSGPVVAAIDKMVSALADGIVPR